MLTKISSGLLVFNIGKCSGPGLTTNNSPVLLTPTCLCFLLSVSWAALANCWLNFMTRACSFATAPSEYIIASSEYIIASSDYIIATASSEYTIAEQWLCQTECCLPSYGNKKYFIRGKDACINLSVLPRLATQETTAAMHPTYYKRNDLDLSSPPPLLNSSYRTRLLPLT
jgi:hypothetical protein